MPQAGRGAATLDELREALKAAYGTDNRGDERTTALREIMAEVMRMDEPCEWYAAMMSGLDIRHGLGEGHPLRGRRMPISTLSLPMVR